MSSEIILFRKVDQLPTLSDYLLLAPSFEQLLKKKIPTAGRVVVTSYRRYQQARAAQNGISKIEITDQMFEDGKPRKIGDSALLFPLPVSGSEPCFALVSDVDRFVLTSSSPEWLDETIELVLDEFKLLRQSYTDPLSMAYNGILLRELLSREQEDIFNHIVLVEIVTKNRTPKDKFLSVQHATRSLFEFNRHDYPLFHLGQCIFGILVPLQDRKIMKSFCLSLVTFAKSKGWKRVHCGYSNIKPDCRPLDEAWAALHTACNRGPFAFCDYEILAHPERFSLHDLPRKVVKRLQRFWKDMPSFALALVKPDFVDIKRFSAGIKEFLPQNISMISAEQDYLLLIADTSPADLYFRLDHLEKLLISEHGDSFKFSAGISEYPFRNYSKTEIVRNCQKAFKHAELLGPNSRVICNALSFNVSGDIFFAEGFLADAAREYRKGLALHEENINLLNSLGVTYALMNRIKSAQKVFRQVLAINPDNFMAGYNLGLGELALKNYTSAVKIFDRALEHFSGQDQEELAVFNDLLFQFGVACFHIKDYNRCIALMERWHREQDRQESIGKCSRYLGISFYYKNDFTQAMVWLQRALVFDENDAESLSLLGELYFQCGEGNQIALRLCRKSVELNGQNPYFLLRYAKLLIANGEPLDALTYLGVCRRKKEVRYEAWVETISAYGMMRKRAPLKRYAVKLIQDPKTPKEIVKKIEKILAKYSHSKGQ